MSNKINTAKANVSSALSGIRSAFSSGLSAAKNTVYKYFREYRVGDQRKDGIGEKCRIKCDRRIKEQIQLFLEPSKN